MNNKLVNNYWEILDWVNEMGKCDNDFITAWKCVVAFNISLYWHSPTQGNWLEVGTPHQTTLLRHWKISKYT